MDTPILSSPYSVLTVLAIITLIVLTVFDIKKRTLPFSLFVPILIFSAINDIGVFSQDWFWFFVTALGFGALFTVFAAYSQCGGGDVIMVTVIGACFGFFPTTYIIIAASGGMLLWFVAELLIGRFRSKKLKNVSLFRVREIPDVKHISYPYAPFVLFGFIIYVAIQIGEFIQ
jgi:Flp pilus assembly protein protease CpaA